MRLYARATLYVQAAEIDGPHVPDAIQEAIKSFQDSVGPLHAACEWRLLACVAHSIHTALNLSLSSLALNDQSVLVGACKEAAVGAVEAIKLKVDAFKPCDASDLAKLCIVLYLRAGERCGGKE